MPKVPSASTSDGVVKQDQGVPNRPQAQVYGQDPSAYTIGGVVVTSYGGVAQGGGGGGTVTPPTPPPTPTPNVSIAFSQPWEYESTGSIWGSASIINAYGSNYTIQVFAEPTGDIEYYQGSSKIFLAAVEFDSDYSYAYTGNVTGTTDLDSALYTTYPVSTYVVTDAEYLQSTVQAGGAGTWGPATIFGAGIKIAKLLNSGTIYGHSQTASANDWLVASSATGTKVAKLFNASGSVVYEVRGAGPALPGLVGTPVAWWDATNIGGLFNDDKVSVWQDRSASNRDATSGGTPLYKTNIFNGLPAVYITSGNTFSFTQLSLNGGVGTSFTIIAVFKSTADSMLMGHSVSNMQVRYNRSAANECSLYQGATEMRSSTLGTTVGNPLCVTWRMAGAGGGTEYRENTTSRTSGTPGTEDPNLILNRIGTTSYGAGFTGHIAEIIVYATYLTDATVDAIYDNYLKPKWGLP